MYNINIFLKQELITVSFVILNSFQDLSNTLRGEDAEINSA
jgi:hypothetical protein